MSLSLEIPASVDTFVRYSPAQQIKAMAFVLSNITHAYLPALSRKELVKFNQIMGPILRIAHEMADNPKCPSDESKQYVTVYLLEQAMKYHYGTDGTIPPEARPFHRPWWMKLRIRWSRLLERLR